MHARQLRALRGVVAGSLTIFTALVAHIAGGGAAPDWMGIAAPLVLAILVSTILAGRRPSLPRLVASVIASQLLFHILFAVGAPAATSGGSHAGMSMSMSMMMPLAAAGPAASMPVTHVVAALVTIAALWTLDRVLRGLLAIPDRVRSWLRRIAGVVPVVVMAVSGHAARIDRDAPTLRSRFLTAQSQRGPPPSLVH